MKSCTIALVVLVTLSVIQLTVANRAVCKLAPVPGYGNLAQKRYYWDSGAQQCRQFTFKGNGGNGNRFVTLSDCNAACKRN